MVRRLRGESAPAPPTGKSFRFVRACDARCSYPTTFRNEKCRRWPLSFIFAPERLYLLSPGPVSLTFWLLHFPPASYPRKFVKRGFPGSSRREFSKRVLEKSS